MPDVIHDHAHIQFYMHPTGKLNKRKTEEAKRPVYDDIEMVRFLLAGDNKFQPHYNADDYSNHYHPETNERLRYKDAYETLYKRFKEGLGQDQGGVRLEVLPGILPGQISTLKGMNIHTIEALASTEGKSLGGMMDSITQLQRAAREYLSSSESDAEILEARARIAELEAKVAQMSAGDQTSDVKPANTGDIIPPDDGPFEGWGRDQLLDFLKDNGKEFPKNSARKDLIKPALDVAAANEAANKGA